jgi:prepilin-type N-terminal cleavage/methylation domain-containing protein
MNFLRNNRGFTLIELIITAVIINILAAVAIVAYVGTMEKSRVATVIRTASTSTSDLQLWLQSSLNDRRHVRELDTNLDGLINDLDKTNGELLIEGVANTYILGRTNTLREVSPWFDRPLWNSDDPATDDIRGTISLRQPQANQLLIVAQEKNGLVVYEHTLFSN